MSEPSEPKEATEPNEPAEPLDAIASAPVATPLAGPVLPDVPHLLDAGQIRARRRPRAVFFVWAWELACAVFIATPIHAWAVRALGTHPDGDAVIFRPGGHALLSWLGDDTPALAIVIRTTFLAILIFGVLGQIVTGALVASLATGTGKEDNAPPASFALRVGGAAFFPLMGISVVTGAIEGFILGIGLFASSAADHALQASLGDARAFTVRLVVLALFVVATLMAGVVGDLGRVAIARDIAADPDRQFAVGRRLRQGVVTAIRTARTSVGRATIAWGWRAALSVALIYAGAVAGDLVGGRGGGALWLLFGVHQLVILTRAGLRASWLANALRLVDRAES